MAVIATTATGGKWSAISTWTGGVLPNLTTDTVTITGTSTLTVDVALGDLTNKITNAAGRLNVSKLGSISTVPADMTIYHNDGLLDSSAGTITINNGIIYTNNEGTITTNNGTIYVNAANSTITTNNHIVYENNATITTNNFVVVYSSANKDIQDCEKYLRNLIGKYIHGSNW